MGLLDTVKRLVGLGGERPVAGEGTEITVHLEHPGADDQPTPTDDTPLEEIKGIGPTYGTRLREAGIDTIAALADADAAALAGRTDIAETRLATWIDRARARLDRP